MQMRRKDREVTDPETIKEIILGCDICRLGLNDDGEVYIVPLDFGFTEENGKYIFYFHGAKVGRKHNIFKKNNYVGFELDRGHKVYSKKPEIACMYSAMFQSIIGTGRIYYVEELEEKTKGLLLIMKHGTGRDDWEFKEAMLNSVSVYKLEVEKLSCKDHE